ncbi:T9SS type A sorting domain-containing protein [Pontibacter sp. Tf4]|uniref:T9SS type A sorting domain-containing protein n=1 Tax=Pontibacter sp. Tf4 TaxID=2761620 RepID=UPI00162AF5BD|nr:T9SS type A sorting domain-containing protein [Pontibacter sp. Tf4]MBB6611288.1 T9SS type A sorting domain-containing protein [Pontibacter sp. Tf4]
MKNINFFLIKADSLKTKQLQFLWRFTLLMLGVLLITSNIYAQKSGPDPGRGGTAAGFEVDSDFKSGFIPTWWTSSSYTIIPPNASRTADDWSKGSSGNAVLKQVGGVSTPGSSVDGRSIWQVDGNWGNNSVTAEVASFAGTSNKNGNPIGTGQSPYLIQLGGSGPQKNDITNTYLHGREDINGDTWLFFGAETRSTSGNSYLDFEYNQAGVKIEGSNLVGNGSVNGRTVNDFLLVINYTGGGNRPVVGIRKWLATGTWSDELPVTELGAFVTTNSGIIDAVAPNKAFTGDGAFANTVMALQFVEGGINISKVPGLEALNRCSPEATVTVKTRSSSSYTAELKDFDILNFQLVPGSTLSDISPLTKCPGESAVFTTTVGGEGALGSNVKWYKVTGTTETEITSGITFTATTSTLTLTNLTTGDGATYKAKLFGATCGEPSKTALLTVNPTPQGTNTTMSACPTTIGGSTATFDLTTKNGTVTGDVAGVSVEGWYETYASGAFSNKIESPESYTSATGKTVYAKLTGAGGCIGVAQNALTVTPSPTGTSTSQTLCSSSIGGSVAIFDLTTKNSTVTGGATGVTVEGWYETYANGVFSNQIASADSYESGSKTVYAKLIGAGSCIGVAQNVLTVNTSPTGTNTFQTLCSSAIGGNTATFNLTTKNSTVTGNIAGVSVEGWYETYSANVFSNPILTPTAYTSGNKTVYAKLTGNGGCIGVAQNVLTVSSSPQGTNTTMTSCPTTIGGSTAVFNLTTKNSTVTGGAQGVSVAGWYETYSGGVFSNPISTPATYTSSSKTVYAQLSGAGNCIGVAQNALTVTPSPGDIDVDITDPSLCGSAYATVTVTSEVLAGSTYTLVSGGVTKSVGPTTAGQVVSFSGSANDGAFLTAGAGYSLTVVNAGGCSSDPAVCEDPVIDKSIQTNKASSIEAKDKVVEDEATAYPIPFYDRTTIEFRSERSGNYVIHLYDMKGKLIRELKSGTVKAGETQTIEVDGKDLAEGMYLARIVNGSGSKTVKLLKRK